MAVSRNTNEAKCGYLCFDAQYGFPPQRKYNPHTRQAISTSHNAGNFVIAYLIHSSNFISEFLILWYFKWNNGLTLISYSSRWFTGYIFIFLTRRCSSLSVIYFINWFHRADYSNNPRLNTWYKLMAFSNTYNVIKISPFVSWALYSIFIKYFYENILAPSALLLMRHSRQLLLDSVNAAQGSHTSDRISSSYRLIVSPR